MGLLGKLPRFVGPGGLRQVILAVRACDMPAHLVDRRRRHVEGVRAHVGDETGRPLLAQLDTLIQLLGDEHGLDSRKAQLVEGVLLEAARDEGRQGVARFHRRFDRDDREGLTLDVRHDLAGLGLIGELGLLLADLLQGRGEDLLVLLALGRLFAQVRLQAPVLLRHEGQELALAVDDQPQRHRLDATGGQAPGDLAPQERTQEISDDPIQDAAGLLGLYLVDVEFARGTEGRLDGVLRDLVELHAVDLLVLELHPLLEVPPDRLALAVRVCSEVDRVDLLGFLLELTQELLLARDDDKISLVVVVDLDPELLLGQVDDVPHG